MLERSWIFFVVGKNVVFENVETISILSIFKVLREGMQALLWVVKKTSE